MGSRRHGLESKDIAHTWTGQRRWKRGEWGIHSLVGTGPVQHGLTEPIKLLAIGDVESMHR